MKTLGLDIGTTTICAVVYETERGVLSSKSAPNDTFVPAEPWARLQDPRKIARHCVALAEQLLALHPDVCAIGLTGQMHGIVYLNRDGEPVSPLYIWQDGRGDLPYDAETSWAEHLSELTGYALATGYATVTHYYNINHGLVPEDAAVFCTIHDYVAMKLAGRTSPVTDPTDAASLGLYDVDSQRFDREAIKKAGIDPALLPSRTEDPFLGIGPLGIPVYAAIGDNQASFLGAAKGRTDALLVNVGTGSQISVYSPVCLQTGTLETRPFPGGGWLLVGASLCGGRSYALLEQFFRQTVKMVTGRDESVYSAMSRALDQAEAVRDYPAAVTTFQGTRTQPRKRGSFSNISTDNFTPVHMMYSVMQGMAQELYDMYREYLDKGGVAPDAIIGSGNALRKNPHLCRVFEEVFGCSLVLSENDEEAACGAAIYAMLCGKTA